MKASKNGDETVVMESPDYKLPSWLCPLSFVDAKVDFVRIWSRWERQGTILGTEGARMIPLKCLLGSEWSLLVPEEHSFNPQMFLKYQDIKGTDIGMVIQIHLSGCDEASMSSKWYKNMISAEDKTYFADSGVSFVLFESQMNTSIDAPISAPSEKSVEEFHLIIRSFSENHPENGIGVMCPSGSNVVGFFIVSYLVSWENFSVDAALGLFSKSRPPGLFYLPFIEELYKRYEDTSTAEARILAQRQNVLLPSWCSETEKLRLQQSTENDRIAKRTYPSLPQITRLYASHLDRILATVKEMNNANNASLCPNKVLDRIQLNEIGGFEFIKENFMVSWRTEPIGIRVLVLILDEGTFFVQKEKVHYLPKVTFQCKKESLKKLKRTLLEAELVLDKVEKEKFVSRLLFTDIFCFEGAVIQETLEKRLAFIEKEIVHPSKEAVFKAIPIRIRTKPYFKPRDIEKLLNKVCPSLPHFHEGLLFRPYGKGEVFEWLEESNGSVNTISISELVSGLKN